LRECASWHEPAGFTWILAQLFWIWNSNSVPQARVASRSDG
jgi:hypothetical protein